MTIRLYIHIHTHIYAHIYIHIYTYIHLNLQTVMKVYYGTQLLHIEKSKSQGYFSFNTTTH